MCRFTRTIVLDAAAVLDAAGVVDAADVVGAAGVVGVVETGNANLSMFA